MPMITRSQLATMINQPDALGNEQQEVPPPEDQIRGGPQQSGMASQTSAIERLEAMMTGFGQLLGNIAGRMSVIEGNGTTASPPASVISVTTVPAPRVEQQQLRSAVVSFGQPAPLLRFNDDGKVHPVDFLRDVEVNLTRAEVPAHDWVRLAIQQMDGMPGDWGIAFSDSWDDWSSFKTAFLDMFWSEDRQERLLHELHHNFYTRQNQKTMTEFFISWMKRVKHLTTPMPMRMFLRQISHLFPANVENVLISARITTPEQMLSILRDIDEASIRRHERTVNETSSNSGVSRSYQATNAKGTTPNNAQWRDREGTGAKTSWRDRQPAQQRDTRPPRVNQLEITHGPENVIEESPVRDNEETDATNGSENAN